MSETILVVAPHADDEVLGCGGAIARHVDCGDSVHILVVTIGADDVFSRDYMNRIHQEMSEAHRLLGVEQTKLLNFPAPRLDTVSVSVLADAIRGVLTEIAPSVVYIPHYGDLHGDHLQVYRASLVATRPLNRNSPRRILAYETLSETDWASPSGDNAFVPTVFIDITRQLSKKLAAMSCYQSQLKPPPYSRSLRSIEALAHYRGGTVGLDAAEAFILIREVQISTESS